MTAVWPWPVHHTLRQRLRSSEANRRRVAAPAHARTEPGPPPVRHRGCQWPLWPDGARPTGLFCGAPTVARSSWCAAHHAIAVIPPFMAAEEEP